MLFQEIADLIRNDEKKKRKDNSQQINNKPNQQQINKSTKKQINK